MKTRISTNVLESALSRCFDASERKSAESIAQFDFNNGSLTIKYKGAFTFYEETIKTIVLDEEAVFMLKTSTLLEFVKHTSSEELLMAYDDKKKTCIISSGDKKSKLALQAIDGQVDPGLEIEYPIDFAVSIPDEFITKLNFASKFCSSNFQDHPLTGIHCSIDETDFTIKSTNGSSFYKTSMIKDKTESIEFYLPKKAPSIIKNIFGDLALERCLASDKGVLFVSGAIKLKIFLERCEKDSFPNQISEWTNKPSCAELRVSVHQLTKALKFFNGVFQDNCVNFIVKDGSLLLESNENNMAAKESVIIEEGSGNAHSNYSSKLFLDCLDSLQTQWVNIEFINMKEDFALCKLTSNQTVALLCPIVF